MSEDGRGSQDTSAPDARPDPLVGKVLGDRYRVIRSLGAGGMAAVYLAEHQMIGRQVAIKMPHRKFARDEGLVWRFLKEGRAAGMLGHPNIAACTDMGYMPDGSPFLVFEYLEGCTLAHLIETEAPLHPVRAARIGVQIASALTTAHAARIIHRDLKPENIFIVSREDSAEQVKVLDFGLSKFTSEAYTRPGTLMGTPMYMAPEQILAPLNVDERVDIYALGVILYHMIDGWPPFNVLPSKTLFERVLGVVPRSLKGRYPDLPPGFADLVERALEKNREKRPASMREFETALRPFANLTSPTLEGMPAIVPPPGSVTPQWVEPPPPPPPPQAAAPEVPVEDLPTRKNIAPQLRVEDLPTQKTIALQPLIEEPPARKATGSWPLVEAPSARKITGPRPPAEEPPAPKTTGPRPLVEEPPSPRTTGPRPLVEEPPSPRTTGPRPLVEEPPAPKAAVPRSPIEERRPPRTASRPAMTAVRRPTRRQRRQRHWLVALVLLTALAAGMAVGMLAVRSRLVRLPWPHEPARRAPPEVAPPAPDGTSPSPPATHRSP